MTKIASDETIDRALAWLCDRSSIQNSEFKMARAIAFFHTLIRDIH